MRTGSAHCPSAQRSTDPKASPAAGHHRAGHRCFARHKLVHVLLEHGEEEAGLQRLLHSLAHQPLCLLHRLGRAPVGRPARQRCSTSGQQRAHVPSSMACWECRFRHNLTPVCSMGFAVKAHSVTEQNTGAMHESCLWHLAHRKCRRMDNSWCSRCRMKSAAKSCLPTSHAQNLAWASS